MVQGYADLRINPIQRLFGGIYMENAKLKIRL